MSVFEALVAAPPFSVTQAEKERAMLDALNDLTAHHHARSEGYARIVDRGFGGLKLADSLADVPYLPVGLFKHLELSSTSAPTLVLRSSGTSGQTPSRIVLDAETSARQSLALVSTFKSVLGEKRIPLLVVDTRQVITDPAMMTARGAGVLGMMKFGAKAAFALNNDLAVDKAAIAEFVAKNGHAPFFLFGFTFLVWSALYRSFADGELDLSNATLIHSGGWKKLEAERVSNPEFRAALRQRFGMTRVYNFYGMVEQIGSVFLEGEDGLLYPPSFTNVIIRDPETWSPLGPGRPGLIQVQSLLPLSYPGHSLLTEDIGEVVTVDAGVGGRLGQAVRILGRVPRAELRGCSDVIAAAA
jgi:acyl-CoA synthetase (AMP-forming)/AMP-acid ligase II